MSHDIHKVYYPGTLYFYSQIKLFSVNTVLFNAHRKPQVLVSITFKLGLLELPVMCAIVSWPPWFLYLPIL